MGNTASMQKLLDSISESKTDLKKFHEIFAPIAVKDKEGLSLRKKEWTALDYNAGGKVSLAECWGWIEGKLNDSIEDKTEATRLYKLYRPSYILAFNDANDIELRSDEDLVTPKEFRVLVAYFCTYAAVQDCFSLIDGGGDENAETPDDRRISLEEWLEGYPIITEKDNYGFVCISNWMSESNKLSAEEIFKEMDSNGAGMVLLNEFAAYFKNAEIEAGTTLGNLLSIGD